ncbi:MAG: hypothetical protein R2873_29570 [Caldilineaceae bacterium]
MLTNLCVASSASWAAQTPKGGSFDVDAHHKLAADIAAEGMVLLKNDGLLLKEYQQIAVIGRAAEKAHFQGGSSHINPTKVAVPYQSSRRGRRRRSQPMPPATPPTIRSARI